MNRPNGYLIAFALALFIWALIMVGVGLVFGGWWS